MIHPRVSIITPTYRHGAYITQCIESVRHQSFQDWEMIVIDDGSPDATADIVEEFVKHDSRIRLIRHGETWGIQRLGETYNQAFDASSGEIIAILEGDDFWPTGKLAAQVPLMADTKVVLCWGRTGFTDSQGRILGTLPSRDFPDAVRDNSPPGSILRKLMRNNFIPPASVLCRRSALNHIGGFRSHADFPAVDYPTFLELSLIGAFRYVDEIIGCWRIHPEQSSQKLRARQIEGGNILIREFHSRLPRDLAGLPGMHLPHILKRRRGQIGNHHLFLGRVLSASKKWRSSRIQYLNALKTGRSVTIPLALLGWGLSYFRCDLEKILHLMNKI